MQVNIIINVTREKKTMDVVEAHGCKSICQLLDVKDWDTARARLKELGVSVVYHKVRPVVSIDEVRIASKKWFKKQRKK